MESLAWDDPPLIGGYELRARLGAGGFGVVYLGLTAGGRAVAVKVIQPKYARDEKFLHRFRLEVAAAQRVNGLFTARVVAAAIDDRPPWVATEFVPGPPLDQFVSLYGPPPEEALWRLLAGLVEALQAIHACGLVHRDLKPANVLLAAGGPRVIDFGISKQVDGSAMTSAGVVMGSPGFMSPEQARGVAIGPATDVFALGCVLAVAATGRPPFGNDIPAFLYRVVHEEPSLDQVPPRLLGVIKSCLAKDPAARPSLALLADMGRNSPGNAPRQSPAAFWPPSVSRAIRDYEDRFDVFGMGHHMPPASQPLRIGGPTHTGGMGSGQDQVNPPRPQAGPSLPDTETAGLAADPPIPPFQAPGTRHGTGTLPDSMQFPTGTPSDPGPTMAEAGSARRLPRRFVVVALAGAVVAAAVAVPLTLATPNAGSGSPVAVGSSRAPALPVGWSSGRAVNTGAGGYFGSVSCPEKDFCVAADNVGDIYTYSDGGWSKSATLANFPIESVSCPTKTFCAAVAFDGNTYIKDNGKWSISRSAVFDGTSMSAVSCPTAAHCFAASEFNIYIYSKGIWRNADRQGVNFDALSCPTASFCVAADQEDNVYTYSAGNWSVTQPVVGGDYFFDVSCPTEGFCGASGSGGVAYIYDDGSWSNIRLRGADGGIGYLTGISCPAAGYCVAMGINGDYIYSHHAWTPEHLIQGAYYFSAISCAGLAFCVATDEGNGNGKFHAYTYTAG